MSFIREIWPRDAKGELARVYRTLPGTFDSEASSGVDPLITAMSLQPAALYATRLLAYSVVFGGSTLGPRLEELISLVVASQLGCKYCTTRHSMFMKDQQGTDLDERVKLASNWRSATLTEAEYAALEFSEKLTFQQSRVSAADIERLHEVGFSDEQVLGIVMACAYRNYISRVADGLGVDLVGEYEDAITDLFETS